MKNAKTVRFSQIVSACGKPYVHLTLLPPEKDKDLLRENKKNCVMTLHQVSRGAGSDYGSVGLFKTKSSQVLVFPKSLRRYINLRVVGIKYDLLKHSDRSSIHENEAPQEAGSYTAKVAVAKASKTKIIDVSSEVILEKAEAPPTMREIVVAINTIRRLLNTRKIDKASDQLSSLGLWIESGLQFEGETPH